MKSTKHCVAASAVVALSMWCQVLAGVPKAVVINEFMASNTKTLKDSQGQFDDWIELYNTTASPINVGGMSLTDSLSKPLRWRIPSDTMIGAHAALLIWADGDLSGGGLHAGFSLSSAGEKLGLFDANGTLVDSIAFKDQTPDLSYGRWPDGNDTWQFMSTPTPGAANQRGYEGVVADVEVSPHRGFYEEPFELTLTTSSPGAEIWYTVNGDTPHTEIVDARGGESWVGEVYTGPIGIDATLCIRAVAVKPGWKDSAVVSHTLIFLEDVIHQPANPTGFPSRWGARTADYAMDPRVVASYESEIRDDLKGIPSVCITAPIPDLFGANGIYSNSTAKGDSWERAAGMEWIDPCTGDHFGLCAGLRIAGGDYARSRTGNPKQGLQFFFRSRYGRSRLEYPLFPDTQVRSFSRVGLREIWNYSFIGDSGGYGPDYLRDLFARDTVRDLGGLTSHGRPVHVYINGLYWGMYIMTERIDDEFAADYLGGDKEDYDVLEAPSSQGATSVMKVISGDKRTTPPEWNTLFSMAAGNVATAEAYQAIQQYVDVNAMIDYMLMVYHTGSRDGPTYLGHDNSPVPRNFSVVRSRDPAGPFIFVPWDTEWCLESPSENRVAVIGGVANPQLLMIQLSANPEFKMLLADRIHRAFHNAGPLTREASTQRYQALANQMYGAIVGESARWGDVLRSPGYTRSNWQTEVNRIISQFFSGRTETVVGQLKTRGWYPSIEPPVLMIDGKQQYGGYAASAAALSMASSSGGNIYYTLDGSDPRPPQQTTTTEAPSIVLVSQDADKRVVVPSAAIDDAWKGGSDFNDSAWALVTGSPGGIGFDRTASSGGDYTPWISLNLESQMYGSGKNSSCYIRIPFVLAASDVQDLASLTLKLLYDDGFVAYLNGVEIQRASFAATPAWNSRAGASRNAGSTFSSYDVSGSLNALRQGENVLAIQGMNSSSSSDDLLIVGQLVAGKGATGQQGLSQYKAPVRLTRSTHVKARVSSGTTWSALADAVYSVGPVAQDLRISEMMVHPKDPNTEFVELTNAGIETINLALVQFTEGIHFAFPSADLAPGQFCLVVSDANAFEAVYGKGLPVAGTYSGSLSNSGEQIKLCDAAGQVIEDFAYSADWYDLADGQGFSLEVRDVKADPKALSSKDSWRPSTHVVGTPGRLDDLATVPAPGTIVINELLANSPKGRPDWIELYNSTEQAVDVSGWLLSDDANDLAKYAIPAGTVLEAHGYKVFYQDLHFGQGFGLSGDGESVYLQAAAGGQSLGYKAYQKFGASEAGVSLGRYVTSAGGVDFVAQVTPTPGAANGQPKTGPVVISEILYDPNLHHEAEYVELVNAGSEAVALSDPCAGQSWRLSDGDNPGIDFVFPADRQVALQPGQRLLVVKNSSAFTPVFGEIQGVEVFEWLSGSLDNGGDWVRLYKPEGVESDGQVRWILVDQVHYSDGTHAADFAAGVDPWPAEANGRGKALGRVSLQGYGNDAANWQPVSPSPGQP